MPISFVSINSKITATDYNTLQAGIANLLGTGSGDSGYGQTLTSFTVTPGTTITASLMANLMTDMTKVAGHQGTVISLPTITAGNKVLASDSNTLYNIQGNLYALRLNIGAGQYSTETLSTVTRTTSWGSSAKPTLTHTVTITFSDANTARNFFNAGGKILFTASRSGGSVSTQNTDWTNILSAMGTIYFNYNSTTASSGTGTGIGWYNLTTTPQQIFLKSGNGGETGGSKYATNDYKITAVTNTGLTQITFVITFDDFHTSSWSDTVDGNLNSTVSQQRPTGSYVSIPYQTVSSTNTML